MQGCRGAGVQRCRGAEVQGARVPFSARRLVWDIRVSHEVEDEATGCADRAFGEPRTAAQFLICHKTPDVPVNQAVADLVQGRHSEPEELREVRKLFGKDSRGGARRTTFDDVPDVEEVSFEAMIERGLAILDTAAARR